MNGAYPKWLLRSRTDRRVDAVHCRNSTQPRCPRLGPDKYSAYEALPMRRRGRFSARHPAMVTRTTVGWRTNTVDGRAETDQRGIATAFNRKCRRNATMAIHHQLA